MTLRDVSLPPHAVDQLPSGLTLLAIQRRGVPLFHARLSLPAGSAADPPGKCGLAQFTAELLRRGSVGRTAEEIDEWIEGMGAHLHVDPSLDETALSLSVPSELGERALEALLSVALTPVFDPEEVHAARRRALSGLQSDLDEPGTIAGRAVVALGYGRAHPYGHPAAGLRAHVDGFGREDAMSFHAARYRAKGALLCAVSEAAPDELLRRLRARAEAVAWPAGASDKPLELASLPPHPGLRAIAVHKPDATQTQVRIVSPGLARTTPRYAAAVVANTALGGGFTSVLVDAIRVDRGLSYSVSSRLAMGRHAGLCIFSSFTKNETLRELVDVALDKMRDYARTGPSADALDKARTYLAGLFPLSLDSSDGLAEQVADALLDGVGLSRLTGYRSQILSVTREQAAQAARDLSPAREGAQLVVVGDAQVAAAALADLCPVEIRQLEEFA